MGRGVSCNWNKQLEPGRSERWQRKQGSGNVSMQYRRNAFKPRPHTNPLHLPFFFECVLKDAIYSWHYSFLKTTMTWNNSKFQPYNWNLFKDSQSDFNKVLLFKQKKLVYKMNGWFSGQGCWTQTSEHLAQISSHPWIHWAALES